MNVEELEGHETSGQYPVCRAECLAVRPWPADAATFI